MKRYLHILVVSAALSFVSCLKEGKYDTTYILRPQVQTQSVDTAEPLAGVVAYAYDVDTLDWGVASYADAAAGIITRKDDPTQQLTEPAVRAVPYDGTAGTPNFPTEATKTARPAPRRPTSRLGCRCHSAVRRAWS